MSDHRVWCRVWCQFYPCLGCSSVCPLSVGTVVVKGFLDDRCCCDIVISVMVVTVY